MRIPTSVIVMSLLTAAPFGLAIRDTLHNKGTFSGVDDYKVDEARYAREQRELEAEYEREAAREAAEEARRRDERKAMLDTLYGAKPASLGSLFDGILLGADAGNFQPEAARSRIARASQDGYLNVVFDVDAVALRAVKLEIGYSDYEGPGCDVLKDKLTAAWGPSVGGTWVDRELHQRASLDTDSCVLAFDRFVEATEWVKTLSLDAIGKNAEKFAESLGPTAEIDADIYWTAPGVGYARGETKLEAYADKNRVVGIKATANADFDSVVTIRDEISAKLKVKPKATDAGGYEWKGRVPVTLEQSGTDFIVVYVGKKLWD